MTNKTGEQLQDGRLKDETRTALRKLARAVAIITSRDSQSRYAMTATAVCEVSLDPPSMLICINRNSAIYRPLSAGADFCINILHREQDNLSALCAGGARGEQRFDSGNWGDTVLGVPRLCDAQASLACRQVAVNDLGSHAVFFGEVAEVFVDNGVDPLIYIDGRYEALARPASA